MGIKEEEKRKLGLYTCCIHAGRDVDPETGAIKRPLVMGNSFKLGDSIDELPEAFDNDR